MAKIKIATDWLDVCSGCHMSFLDMDEHLLELLNRIELTSSPLTDLKVPPEEGVDIGILTGAISDTHQRQTARRMRERCKILVAIGDCAVINGITTMRNDFSLRDVLSRGYIETESTVDGKIPKSREIARLLERSMPIHELVKVDINLPGCPPSAESIYYVIKELLENRIPVINGEYLKYD